MKSIALSLAAATALLFSTSCSETDKTGNKTGDKDTAVLASDHDMGANNPSTGTADAWNDLDWNSPVVKYDEVSSKDIETRGNDTYGIYALGENILFPSGSAALMPAAEANLKQVWTSIQQRYAGGNIRIYGYTDSKGTEDKNAQLSQQRAEAVRAWFMKNGNVPDGDISVQARGESDPVATNSSAEGREQNRRVEIVARRK